MGNEWLCTRCGGEMKGWAKLYENSGNYLFKFVGMCLKCHMGTDGETWEDYWLGVKEKERVKKELVNG